MVKSYFAVNVLKWVGLCGCNLVLYTPSGAQRKKGLRSTVSFLYLNLGMTEEVWSVCWTRLKTSNGWPSSQTGGF